MWGVSISSSDCLTFITNQTTDLSIRNNTTKDAITAEQFTFKWNMSLDRSIFFLFVLHLPYTYKIGIFSKKKYLNDLMQKLLFNKYSFISTTLPLFYKHYWNLFNLHFVCFDNLRNIFRTTMQNCEMTESSNQLIIIAQNW